MTRAMPSRPGLTALHDDISESISGIHRHHRPHSPQQPALPPRPPAPVVDQSKPPAPPPRRCPPHARQHGSDTAPHETPPSSPPSERAISFSRTTMRLSLTEHARHRYCRLREHPPVPFGCQSPGKGNGGLHSTDCVGRFWHLGKNGANGRI